MKYNSETMRFAVIQNGCSLYGVGATRTDAINNSIEWIDDCETFEDVEQKLIDNPAHGQFYIETDPEQIEAYVKNI